MDQEKLSVNMLLNVGDLWIALFFQKLIFTTCKGIKTGNIALGKTAYQSSTYTWIVSPDASKAVDGGVDNRFEAKTCTHTSTDNISSAAWWEVDLQNQFWIGDVSILNRAGAIDRLHDVEVDVYVNKNKPREKKRCTTHTGPAGPGWLNLSCVSPVMGRFVRITKPQKDANDVLTLCEVEIYELAGKTTRPMEPTMTPTMVPPVGHGFGSVSFLNCCSICG